jgi:CDP-glucose 4,6-dehydratase
MQSLISEAKMSFWYGKNVLITGGNGFVASNLAIKLMLLGANVNVTVRHRSDHDTIRLLSGKEFECNTEITDMHEYIAMKNLLDRRQIDTIFHIAASAIVSKAAGSPYAALYNNILPTVNILEAARANGVKRLVIASSDKAYGDHSSVHDIERIPYRESYALRGLDVYSASKACADIISQIMASQYKQHIIITRCCNIFGPGDLNFTRLIPRTVMRLLSGKAPVINDGNSEVLREYIFINDVIDGYLFLAEHTENYYEQDYPQKMENVYGYPCFNIGSYSGEELLNPRNLPNIKDVQSVMAIITGILERDYAIDALQPQIIPKGPNFIEIPDQYLDSSKLHQFGFVPKTKLEDGLKQTIKWYNDNFELFKRYGAQYLI